MQRMSGIDPMFVYSDTAETPMEIAYVCVLDPATAPGGYSFERVVAVLESRIPTLGPLRRRLMPVPLGLDHPRWVDDPDYDLSNHLHRAAVPAPGGAVEFAAMVAHVMGRPLLPRQPPWEMHMIEGLEGGMVGLIAKVHHAVVDGVAGAEMLARLLDLTPEDGAVAEPGPPWIPARLPSQVRLVTDALPSVVRSPMRVLQAAREVGRTAVRLARCVVDDGAGPVTIPLGAPATFETPVGALRAVAFARLDMAKVHALKERFSSTVNDVVLAVCSGALRSHLAAHGEAVDSPLVAVVPVSVRADPGAESTGGGGNQLSAMFVRLANDRQTPLERLRVTTATSASCKVQERAVGYGPVATRMAEAVPPALAKPVIQFGVRSGALRRVRAGNLMVSNVPGPTIPLYFAGMELQRVYPLGPVLDGVALNVTVQGYCESLFVGINASAAAVPDLAGLAEAMEDELTLLAVMAAGAGPRPRRAPVPPRQTAEAHTAAPGRGGRRRGAKAGAGTTAEQPASARVAGTGGADAS